MWQYSLPSKSDKPVFPADAEGGWAGSILPVAVAGARVLTGAPVSVAVAVAVAVAVSVELGGAVVGDPELASGAAAGISAGGRPTCSAPWPGGGAPSCTEVSGIPLKNESDSCTDDGFIAQWIVK